MKALLEEKGVFTVTANTPRLPWITVNISPSKRQHSSPKLLQNLGFLFFCLLGLGAATPGNAQELLQALSLGITPGDPWLTPRGSWDDGDPTQDSRLQGKYPDCCTVPPASNLCFVLG